MTELGSITLLFFNKRNRLAKLFEKWCKENDVDDKDTTNMITWLNINNLLNVDETEKFLKDNGE